MKKLYYLFIFLINSTLVLSQSNPEIIKNEIKKIFQKEGFRDSILPFTFLEEKSNYNGKYKKLRINKESLSKIEQAGIKNIKLILPFSTSETKVILLQPTELFASDVKIVQSFLKGNQEIKLPTVYAFNGIIENTNLPSLVSITIINGTIRGIISEGNDQFILGPIQDNSKNEDYVLYNQSINKLAKAQVLCGVSDAEVMTNLPSVISKTETTVSKCVRLHFEITQGLQNMWGGTTQSIEKFVNILNNVVTIYKNDGIYVKLSYLKIWSMKEPYNLGSSTLALNSFYSSGGTIYGDEAHLLHEYQYGGLATIPGSLNCQQVRAVSGMQGNFDNFPNYSWNVMVVAHELGHNLTSPHTQWCGWVGGAIDNCYPTEGGCPPGPAPVNGGTIMSYCHLSNTGINFINGFGSQPGSRIRNSIATSSCMTSCDDNVLCTDSIARNVITIYDSSTNKIKISFDAKINEQYKIKWELVGGNLKDSTITVGPVNTVVFTPYCNNNNPDHLISIERICSSGYGPKLLFYFKPIPIKPQILFDNSVICSGVSKYITASPSSSLFRYKWYKDGIEIVGQTNDSLLITSAGTYSVFVNKGSSGECWAESDPVVFTLTTQPLPKFTYSYSSLYKISFSDQSLFSSNYRWDFGAGQVSNSSNPPIIDFVKSGRYPVTLQTDGCGGTSIYRDTIKIIVEEFGDQDPKMGTYENVQIIEMNCSKVAYFNKNNNSTIKYLVGADWPRQGTIEWQLKIDSGYASSNIYQDVFYIMGNAIDERFTGDLTIEINNTTKKISFYSTNPPPYLPNVIGTTTFSNSINFKNWNTLGFSWGSNGIYFRVNGTLLPYFPTPLIYGDTVTQINNKKIGVGIGNGYFGWDTSKRGFYGYVDKLRVSAIQQDFKISNLPPVFPASPTLNYSDSVSFCPIDSIVLTVSPIIEGNSYQWKLNNQIIVGANLPVYKASVAGQYACEVKNNSGAICSTASLKVKAVSPSSIFNYTKDALQVVLNNTSLCASQYNWNFDDGTFSSLKDPIKVYSQSGYYNVCLNSSNNSSSTQNCKLIPVFSSWIDELKNTTDGIGNAITYQSGICDQSVKFTRNSSSNPLLNSYITYSQQNWVPKQGTIEILCKVTNGSSWNGISTTNATLFAVGTGVNSTFITVNSNGNIGVRRSDGVNFVNFTATATPFRFNEWHVISLSYGSNGTSISVDGAVYLTNTTITYNINNGDATLGQTNWGGGNWFGFEGLTERIRFSYLQNDFQLKASYIPSVSISGSTTVINGQSSLISTMAQNGGSIPQYQWQDSSTILGWANIIGATNSALSYSPINSGVKLRCQLSSNANCVNPAIVISNTLIFTVNTPTAITDPQNPSMFIRIAPNPSNQFLNISGLSSSKQYQYILTDYTGRILIKGNIYQSSQQQISTNNLPSGVYLLQLYSVQQKRVLGMEKIVIIH